MSSEAVDYDAQIASVREAFEREFERFARFRAYEGTEGLSLDEAESLDDPDLADPLQPRELQEGRVALTLLPPAQLHGPSIRNEVAPVDRNADRLDPRVVRRGLIPPHLPRRLDGLGWLRCIDHCASR